MKLIIKNLIGVTYNKIEMVALFVALTFFSLCSGSWAANYYASPSGGGDGSSIAKSFQISKFWNVASPGDTLYLVDGVYTDINSMITPPKNIDGTAKNYITIKALNDGGVLIDGSTTGKPVKLGQNDYINLEGFNASNGGPANQGRVFWVEDSDYVNVRRVVAWDGDPSENSCIFNVSAGSSHVLLEDCAGWGPARKIFGRHEEDTTTYRRCFFRWTMQNEQNPYCLGMTLSYKSTNSIIENCIGTWDETGYITTSGLIKSAIFGVDATSARGNYKILGSIGYQFKSQKGDPKAIFRAAGEDFYTDYTSENCIAYSNKPNIGAILNKDNRFYGSYFTSIGCGYSPGNNEEAVWVNNPINGFNNVIIQDSAKYGSSEGSLINYAMYYNNAAGNWKGTAPKYYAVSNPNLIPKCGNIIQYGLAEESRPKVSGQSVGAKIQYRYIDGVLTEEPLWPWPMNDRIKEALIKSGYDKKGGLDGNGGLNLTKIIFELGGGAIPPSLDQTSPLKAPFGLKVQ